MLRQSTTLTLLASLVTITTWSTDLLPTLGYAIAVLVLFLILSFRGQSELGKAGFPVLLLAAIGLWGLAQLVSGATVYRWATAVSAVQGLALAATALLAFLSIPGESGRAAFLRYFSWFGVGIACVSVLSYWTSYGKILWIFPATYPDNWGPFPSRNTFAQFLELCLPAALYQLRERNFRWTAAVAPAILLGAGLASASRAGAVLLAGETGIVLYLLLRRTVRRHWRTAVVTVALALTIGSIAGAGFLVQRFADPDPLRIRREIFHSTLAMIAEHPIRGFGLGTFSTVYPEFATFDAGAIVEHAHNDWLEWAAEGGIFYAGLWVALAAWVIPRAVRSIWGIGIAAVFLHALVDYPFARLGIAAWVFLMLGILLREAEKSGAVKPLSRRGKCVRIETVQSVLALGCVMNVGLALVTPPRAFAATPVIGTAVARSSFRIDEATVAGNATLLEGARVETQRSSSSLDLSSGPRLLLGVDSKAQVFSDRLILEQGSGEMHEAAGFRVEARGLTVRTDTGHGSARILLAGGVRVQVAALSGGVRVMNSRGLLVAALTPGNVLEFEPQGAGGGSEPEKLTGCLRVASGHYLVTDEVTNVTVEVAGAGLDKEAGNHVQVTGLMDPTGAPVSGATQYIRVSSVRRLNRGCPGDKTAAAGAGGANPGTGGGHGKIIGLSTTALAVIGGVAAAAVVGGLAANGTIGSGSSGATAVSR